MQWAVLLAASLAFIVPLEWIHLPAALLLGAMVAAILVAVFEAKLAVPQWPLVLAQGLIGCLVARSIGPDILATMIRQWPLFLVGVCSVLVISTSLGALLARFRPLSETLALVVIGAVVGAWSKLPAGALLVPLIGGIVLSCTHVITITLPPWLMAGSYALVGWSIGLKFTREIVLYAARVFPTIAASTITLIALCGGLGWLLHVIVGTDPLTAYLATSPGGADSVAIIAASSQVDMPFVMAMQMARFIIVMLLGPTLAKTVARWTGG